MSLDSDMAAQIRIGKQRTFMKKRLLFIIVIVSLLICALPISAFATQQDDIIILYENDVHCEIAGYSALCAMRNELKQEYEHVGIVTSGD